MKIRFSFVLVIIFSIFDAIVAHAEGLGETYEGSHLQFQYPINFYQSITKTRTDGDVEFFDLRRNRGDAIDILTFCNNSLSVCASGDSQIRPYWFDPSDGTLALFHVTATVKHHRTQEGDIYEAYPLCPADGSDGRTIPYGGECYIALITNDRETVSLTYWLGQHVVKSAERSTAIRQARQILRSVRGKK